MEFPQMSKKKLISIATMSLVLFIVGVISFSDTVGLFNCSVFTTIARRRKCY
jgi:hypothetical protein